MYINIVNVVNIDCFDMNKHEEMKKIAVKKREEITTL